ncbi:MAG: DUF4190 domain-containing protein [Planctomycetota bacterium]
MATTEAILPANETDLLDDEFEYRPLSTAAIASVVFGVVSGVTFIAANTTLQHCLMLCPIPLVGLICGLVAVRNLRAMPNELSGLRAAVAGIVMSTIGLVGGLGYGVYVHATEVPPGYERLSFYDLRPDEIESKGNEIIPRDVKDLDGKEVFVKGYMRPGTHVSPGLTPVRHNVSIFMLVRDSNECCFGDISTVKYFDKMDVFLKPGLFTDYSSGMFRVAGKLRIEPPKRGQPEPKYRLEADYVN